MVEKTKRILVPVGFSEQSIHALDQAIIVANLIKADITLLSVVENNSFLKKLFGSDHDEDDIKAQAFKKLKEIIDERENSGVNMEAMVAKGTVYEEVTRVAEMLNADVVIMGTNGRPDNFGKKFVGSNAFRVVKNVDQPVITLKGNRGFSQIKTIVFPIVLDRKSKEKVGECLHWSRIFGASVKIVAVAKDDEESQKLKIHVNQVHDFIKSHSVPVSAEIIKAEGKNVNQVLVNYCEEVNGDLLIIMEDDDSSLISLSANDVQDIMYNAEIPVMCVTPRPSKYESSFSL